MERNLFKNFSHVILCMCTKFHVIWLSGSWVIREQTNTQQMRLICITFGPPAPQLVIFFFDCYHRGRVLNNFPKFMFVPTKKDEELVLIQFYITHIRKKTVLGPRPPMSQIFKIIFTNYRHKSVFSKFPKFHASTYTGRWGISVHSVLYSPYTEKKGFGPPATHEWNFF